MFRLVLRLLIMLAVCLSLTACQPDDGGSGGGGVVVPPVLPVTLGDLTLNLSRGVTGTFTADFGGSWAVSNVPTWLTVAPRAGTGPVQLTVTADRVKATPLNADRPTLSGQISVNWTGGTASAPQSGTATWTVTAEQFQLSGRVLEGVNIQAVDAVPVRAVVTPELRAARGVIVKYRSAGALAVPAEQADVQAAETLESADVAVNDRRLLGPRTAVLNVPDVPAALAALRRDPRVVYAVPNAVLRAQGLPLAEPVVPTDQFAPLQWAFRLLGYPSVWRDMDSGAYSQPVTVAVVDTGVRYDHPDLAGQLWGPQDGALDVLPLVVDPQTGAQNGDGDGPDTDPTDPGTAARTTGSHGTHVTGIIAARWGDNGATCAGCSPTGVVGATDRANVKVLPIRVLDTTGLTGVAEVADAVRYAAGLPVTLEGRTYTNPHPAQVINLSLGNPLSAAEAQPVCEAIQDAANRGSLVVAAAGNGYGTTPYYPANCAAAVAVGSVTLSGGSAPKPAVYSSAYPAVQLVAPGGTDPFQAPGAFNGGVLNDQPYPDMVLSTSWNYARNQPSYESESGTSQAAPQVSALAALLLAKGVTTDAASTLARLDATATDLGTAGRDDQFGYGLINPVAALGAPAVSDTLGLRLQGDQGQAFQPPLDAMGRFTAYLGSGTYTVTGGRDRNGNGIYGEVGEPAIQRTVSLGPDVPTVDVGSLTPP